jgi:hypothetical protein
MLPLGGVVRRVWQPGDGFFALPRVSTLPEVPSERHLVWVGGLLRGFHGLLSRLKPKESPAITAIITSFSNVFFFFFFSKGPKC